MKTRRAKISDYDWIKAMAQRHKAELADVSYGAIKESINKNEVLIAEAKAGFCRWHHHRDGWHEVHELVSEQKGAGGALLLAVPLPRRLRAPLGIKSSGFYKHMGGLIGCVEEGKTGRFNVWVWPAVDASRPEAVPKREGSASMKTRAAEMSDYDWIKAMAQRHKAELGYVNYGAIKESIKKREILVAATKAGFCRWHKRRDGLHVVYDLVSEKKGAGGALLLAVPLPRRLKAPIDIEANGFYKHMGGQIVCVEKGKKRRLNVWVWPAVKPSVVVVQIV